MRTDLQELQISLSDLKEFTGKDLRAKTDGSFGWATYWSDMFAAWFSCFIFLLLSLLLRPLFIVSIGCFFFGLWRLVISLFNLISPVNLKFIKEVVHHNEIILNINTLDQLQAVGNPVQLNEREKVLESLRINREILVRALKTDKILRENPDFRPEQFNIVDLSGLRSLQAKEKATEYGRFLNEALQIGVSVQTEMRKLENKRLGL
jgi:hypothetical protein